MLRVERGTELFPFLAVLGGIFMPCTQDTPLHFTESDNNQPNRKRSREAAHRLHDTANRVTVQSIRTDGRYFTNPASIDFLTRFQVLFPENLCESGSFAKCLQSHLKKRLGKDGWS